MRFTCGSRRQERVASACARARRPQRICVHPGAARQVQGCGRLRRAPPRAAAAGIVGDGGACCRGAAQEAGRHVRGAHGRAGGFSGSPKMRNLGAHLQGPRSGRTLGAHTLQPDTRSGLLAVAPRRRQAAPLIVGCGVDCDLVCDPTAVPVAASRSVGPAALCAFVAAQGPSCAPCAPPLRAHCPHCHWRPPMVSQALQWLRQRRPAAPGFNALRHD